MQRRQFVAAGATLGAFALGGCVGSEAPGADGRTATDEGATGTDSPAPTDGTAADGGETPTGDGPSVTEASLRPLEGGCGTQRDSASVSFRADRDRVVVDGTIWGSNTCTEPQLAGADYDAAADELTVAVMATVPESEETPVCGQCIVELDYRATVDFAGGLPGTVRVVHGSGSSEREVATASAE